MRQVVQVAQETSKCTTDSMTNTTTEYQGSITQEVSEPLWNTQLSTSHEGQLCIAEGLQQQTTEIRRQVKEQESEEMDEIKKPDTMTTQKEKSFEFGPTADKGEAMQPADIRTDSEHETEQEVSKVHELETQWHKVGFTRSIDTEIECFKEKRRGVLKGLQETVTISQVWEALREKRRHKFEGEETMNQNEEVVCNREIKELIHQHEVLTVQEIQANRESLEHREKARWKHHEITALRASGRSLLAPSVMRELEILKEEEQKHMKACQRWEELKEAQRHDNTTSHAGEVNMQRLTHKVVECTMEQSKKQDVIARERRECEEAGNKNLREAKENYVDMLQTGNAEVIKDALTILKYIAKHNAIDRLNSSNADPVTKVHEFLKEEVLCLTEKVKTQLQKETED